MKCKQCGMALTANTLDHCPRCDPNPSQPSFTTSGRILELGYFLLTNILIALGIAFLLYLLITTWSSK